MNTYTRVEAMKILGITSPTAFHHLRRTYPQAFVVVHKGVSKGDPTLYDKQAIDDFAKWRKVRKEYHVTQQ
jgi:hypothetical protein